MDVLVIAHRGASRLAPENTVPAIKKALELGADILALDVQRTQDDVPLVIADVSVDRTTNGTGRLARLASTEVKNLDAGSWFNDEFAGTRVPDLAEALKAVGTKARVMLNLPETRANTPWAANLLKVLAARKKAEDDILVFSDSDSLKSFREAAPSFQYALALGEKVDGWIYLEKAEKMKLKVIRPHRNQIDSVLVRQANSKSISVLAHFADEESDLKSLIELKVNGIITGRPDRLAGLLNRQPA